MKKYRIVDKLTWKQWDYLIRLSASTSIKRTHFAIVWKSIDHKIQGLPLKQDIIDFYLQKQ